MGLNSSRVRIFYCLQL